jgi:L-ribulokinase
VYADVLGRPVLVPSKNVVGLGSAIFAFLAAEVFRTIEEAQDRICPPHTTFTPDARAQRTYDELYPLYNKLYFALGQRGNELGDILPKLIAVAAANQANGIEMKIKEQR